VEGRGKYFPKKLDTRFTHQICAVNGMYMIFVPSHATTSQAARHIGVKWVKKHLRRCVKQMASVLFLEQ